MDENKNLTNIAKPCPQLRELFQKLTYAANSDANTVFFSKKRKNISLCHHHTAPLEKHRLNSIQFICKQLSLVHALNDVGL